jgi:hypothetical protein
MMLLKIRSITFSGTGDISCDFEDGDCVFSNSKILTYDWIVKSVRISLVIKALALGLCVIIETE